MTRRSHGSDRTAQARRSPVDAPRVPRVSARPPREGQLLFRGVQALLIVLAISRYDATSFVFRGEETMDFFNWFWRRRWLGMFSFFDFLLLGLLLLALLTETSQRKQRRPADVFVPFLIALVALSTVVRSVTEGSADTRQAFLFQLRNYVYLGISYFIARRLRWSESRVRAILKLLLSLAVLVVVLYIFETFSMPAGFRVGKYGRLATVRDIADFAFILFAQFWLIAIALERFPARWPQRIGLLALIGYTFYSSFTGIGKSTLLIYPVYLLYFFFHYRLYRRPVFLAALVLGLLVLASLVGYLLVVNPEIEPTSPLYIYKTFTSEDLSVSTRGSEAANFLANLSRRGAWLQGLGLGTKWYEYFEQPLDLGAYPEQERGLPWHLGVHVPLLRIAYDFGIVGLALLLGFFATRFFRSLRFLRRSFLWPATRGFVQASLLAIGYELFVNNLAVPKTNILVGVLLGILQGMTEAVPPSVMSAAATPSVSCTPGRNRYPAAESPGRVAHQGIGDAIA